MRRDNVICLAGFLIGIVGVNVLGNGLWANQSMLNKYSLGALQVKDIAYDSYFIQILVLRMKTVFALWAASKIISKKMIVWVFSGVSCAMLGAVLTMAILANGVWGILFFVSALLSQLVFYTAAYLLWRNSEYTYTSEAVRKENWLIRILILFIMLMGCLCEAYVSPFFMEKVINI